MKLIIKTLILLIIIIFSIITSFFLIQNRATGKIPAAGIEFEIKRGASAYSIADQLFYKKYIRSKLLFKIIIKFTGSNKKLRSGWVELKPDFTTLEIIQTIYNANFVTISFTVPEGYNIKQIKKLLISNNIVTESAINDFFAQPDYLKKAGITSSNSLEGFLFPDTYKFFKGTTPEEIFSAMVDLFYKKTQPGCS